jgi:hypothetical protein
MMAAPPGGFFIARREARMTPRPKTIERVCALVRQGRSLREIAATPRMPSLAALTRWLAEDDTFTGKYEQALAVQRTVFADDVVAIADRGDDSKAADRKLKVDARRWRARKDPAETEAQRGPPHDLVERLEEGRRRSEERWRREREEEAARKESEPIPDDATDEEPG